MLKKNLILVSVAMGAVFGLNSIAWSEDTGAKCKRCKPKSTLELVDHQLAETKPSNNNEMSHQRAENDNYDQNPNNQNSEQSGIEKGNDRDNNDMKNAD